MFCALNALKGIRRHWCNTPLSCLWTAKSLKKTPFFWMIIKRNLHQSPRPPPPLLLLDICLLLFNKYLSPLFIVDTLYRNSFAGVIYGTMLALYFANVLLIPHWSCDSYIYFLTNYKKNIILRRPDLHNEMKRMSTFAESWSAGIHKRHKLSSH